jgi:hypothetical protein
MKTWKLIAAIGAVLVAGFIVADDAPSQSVVVATSVVSKTNLVTRTWRTITFRRDPQTGDISVGVNYEEHTFSDGVFVEAREYRNAAMPLTTATNLFPSLTPLLGEFQDRLPQLLGQ